MSLKIATWNVNSVRVRLPHLITWLQDATPDIVLLQEIKVQTEAFPLEPLEDAGYNIAVYGQKTYNGVALLSKYPLEDIQRGLPGGDDDPQARYIEAVTGGVRVASVYVPNGERVGSEKFAYKLRFLEHLYEHLQSLLGYEESLIIGGDYNITVDDQDVYDPVGWEGEVLCSPVERQALRKLLNLGLTDALRLFKGDEPQYSWWDYRQGSFHQNKGLRIDHLLLSSLAVDRLVGGGIDRHIRALTQPSDHAPVWVSLRD